jgi:hypothetical protein
MHIRLVAVVLTYLMVFSCQKKEKEQGSVLQAIQQTGRLVTVEYTLSKMVRADDNKTWYKRGDRRILISAEAIVKAGVDLQHITAGDVSAGENSISLRVPKPEVFIVSIPPDKINVLYEDVSLFRQRFSAAEREALLRQAEHQIRKLTDSLDILKTAQANADLFLRNLLRQGGYQNITIRFEK